MAKVNGLKACLVLPSWAKLLKFTNCFAGAANRTMKFWDWKPLKWLDMIDVRYLNFVNLSYSSWKEIIILIYAIICGCICINSSSFIKSLDMFYTTTKY